MGGQLVKRAYTAFHLATQRGDPFTANERHVLLYMCTVAHDTDNPPRFWGGREVLAEVALSRRLPSEDAHAERRSIFESVRKAVAGLAKRGAIETVGMAHPGRRQEYVLTVDNCLPAEWTTQPDVGPSATSGWANNNVRLQMAQSHEGPKEQVTPTDQQDTRHTVPAPTYLPPVESEVA